MLRLLEERELSLSTLSLIEPILNEENAVTILERVRGASHRDVERVVCEYRPPLALRDRIRPVRVAVAEPVEIDALMLDRECERTVPDGHYNRRIPMTEQKMLVQFLASEELVEKFEQATALLAGRSSDLSFADVLDVLVTEFLDRRSPAARRERREARAGVGTRKSKTIEKAAARDEQGRRSGATSPDSRRREWNENHSRHVPTAVRDEVYVRDGGRCAFETADGTRCGARKGLEIDHVRPFAAGGTSDASNLRLLCAAHNLRAAERTLGDHVMRPFWRQE